MHSPSEAGGNFKTFRYAARRCNSETHQKVERRRVQREVGKWPLLCASVCERGVCVCVRVCLFDKGSLLVKRASMQTV